MKEEKADAYIKEDAIWYISTPDLQNILKKIKATRSDIYWKFIYFAYDLVVKYNIKHLDVSDYKKILDVIRKEEKKNIGRRVI